MRRCTLVLAVLVLVSVEIRAQDGCKGFDVYGFVDFTVNQLWMDKSSILWTLDYNDEFGMWRSHFNVYGDWRPVPSVRVLGEAAVAVFPEGTGEEPGTRLEGTVDITGLEPTTLDIDTVLEPPTPPVSTTVDHQLDGPVDWGSIYMERLWIDLLFRQQMNVRVGKFITPYGIWNVDHGSPAIMTVRQPYQTGIFRLFPRSQVGIMGYGTAFLGDVDLTYRAYVSTGREEISLEDITDLGGGANIETRVPLLDGLELGVSGFTGVNKSQTLWRTVDVDLEVPTVYRLVFDSTGTLDSAASREATTIATEEAVQDSLDRIVTDFENHAYGYTVESRAREICLNASARLKVGGATLQAEGTYRQVRNHLRNDAQTHIWGGYGLVSYRFRPRAKLSVTPYAMYEQLQGMDAHNNTGLADYLEYFDRFTTILGGVNIGMFAVATLKLEYAYVSIGAVEDRYDGGDMLKAHVFNSQLCVAF